MDHELNIEADKFERQYFRDLWQFRELFVFLAWRDIIVRYKQTAIGILWAVIRPLLTMVVMTIVFGKIAKLPSNGVPYPILVFAGMLPWQFFSNSFSESSSSLISNASMISKVYFPRIVLPVSSVVVSFVDFILSFSILIGLMVWYHFIPGWTIVTLPAFLLLAVLASIGPGFFISALNVKYRDFRYVVPFVVQFGLFITPVGFSTSVVPEKWRLLFCLNPMVGVVDGFRWAIIGGNSPLYLPGLVISIVMVIALCVLGFWYFRKTEKTFADVI